MEPAELIQLFAVTTGLIATIGGVIISYVSLKYRVDKDRPKIRVSMGKNRLMNVPNTNPDIDYLTVSVANVGKQDYTVTMLGFTLGKRSGGVVIPMPLGTVTLPHILAEEKTCNFWTEYKGTVEKLKELPNRERKRMRIRAYITDYAGRDFYSDWLSVDFEDSDLWNVIDKYKLTIKNSIRKIFP